ncbi:MAG: PAS domain S-box protein [Bacteroidota bacterium]
MKNDINIIQEVSTLYELSLAVGVSLDPKKNSEHFLNVLMARKNILYAAVWISCETNSLKLLYASPKNKVGQDQIDREHYIWQQLEENNFFIAIAGSPAFEACTLQANAGVEGCYIIYKLQNFGFLQIYVEEKDWMASKKAVQLINVVDKFALFLNGSLAHERLRNATKERIKIQQALHRSEEKYRSVVQNLSEGIVIMDMNGRITFVNQQMELLTGHSRQELIGAKVMELLIQPAERMRIKRLLAQCRRGATEELLMEHHRRDGRRWIASIKVSPYIDIHGETIGSMGIVSDMTVQQQAEQKIVESEQKMRKVIDASLDAVIAIDEKGIIAEWNQQAEQIFGFSRAEAVNQDMANLIIPHRYRAAHNKGMEHFLATGEGPVLNNRIEISALDKAGKEFPVELSISSIKIKNKYLFSAFMRDITERKQAEADLIAAKQAAEQAQLAEQQFLANMSHEIRTPMNAVIGMTHLLYETQPTEAQRDYLDSLRFSADSLMGIINNILDLSKIEAGALEFEKRTFNLTELLKALQQTFQFKVREKPVSVVIDIDPQLDTHLVGDSVRLTQILTNLLGNASKFTKRGTIGVQTRVVAAMADQYVLQFQVHDTGIGIPEDRIETIFENFKQADVGITRKFGGTGLGLAIVKQLVELQGGSIAVQSQPGKGATFTVTLPFGNSKVKLSEVEIKKDKTQELDDFMKTLQLLVVEDNPMNQKLISKILELWDCPFEIASSGEEGLKYAQAERFDLILMDIHMPEMDGCETTVKIREEANNPNQETPIIALTAAALLDEKNRALDSGMNDFLTKPFAPNALRKMILKWAHPESEQVLELKVPFLRKQEDVLRIDLSYLKDLSKGDLGFVKDMIGIFLREIPEALRKMEEACAQAQWAALSDIAHRIKSNYMMVGMDVQQGIAFQIEKDIKQNNIAVDKLTTMVNQLKADSKLAYPILEEKLKGMTLCPVIGKL